MCVWGCVCMCSRARVCNNVYTPKTVTSQKNIFEKNVATSQSTRRKYKTEYKRIGILPII